MAVLPIRLFPDPVLRAKSKPVDLKDKGLGKFIADLVETLYAQPSGIGIAAAQVGRGVRLAVMDVSPRDPSKKRFVLINPVILKAEGEVLSREGCMSLPDYTATIKRASRVQFEWQDELGRSQKQWVSGIEAICIQHELDHLDGALFIDRVASLKTDIYPRRRR